MTSNKHTPPQSDSQRLDAIERRLQARQDGIIPLAGHHGQDAADSVLDDLIATVPKADAAFQTQLEAALLARLAAHATPAPRHDHLHHTADAHLAAVDFSQRSDSDMNQLSTLQPRYATPQSRSDGVYGVPFTLAAVLCIVLMIGGALSLMSPKPQNPQSLAGGLAQGINPEPTVVCLTHTVQAGDTLMSISLAYDVPVAQLLSINGLAPQTSVVAVGQVLLVDSNCVDTETLHFAIPLGLNTGVRAGDIVDVIAVMQIVDLDGEFQGIVPAGEPVTSVNSDAMNSEVTISRVYTEAVVVGIDAEAQVHLMVKKTAQTLFDFLLASNVSLILIPSDLPEPLPSMMPPTVVPLNITATPTPAQ